jgi:hypothetical protein
MTVLMMIASDPWILFRQVQFFVVRFEQAFDHIFLNPRLFFTLGDGSSLKSPFVGASETA